jgi:hypothetical protein
MVFSTHPSARRRVGGPVRDQSHHGEADSRVTAPANQPPDPGGTISMRIRRGVGAPSRARRSVLGQVRRPIRSPNQPQSRASVRG